MDKHKGTHRQGDSRGSLRSLCRELLWFLVVVSVSVVVVVCVGVGARWRLVFFVLVR